MLIEPNQDISIWFDDVKLGTFDASRYAYDDGTIVAVMLMVDLAMGGLGGTVNTNNFGGANNTTDTNLYRLGIRNIQIWGA